MTQALTRRFGNSGVDYPDAEAGWLVEAAPVTAGGRNENGRSGPAGRRQEDDVNLVAGTVRSHVRPGSNESGGVVTVPSVTSHYGKGTDSDATDPMVVSDEVSAPVTAKWAKGNGGPAGDEAQNLTFVKRHGASTVDDHETWDEDDIARTLNGMGQAGANGALAVSLVQETFNLMPRHGGSSELEAYPTDEASGLGAAGLTRQNDRGTRVVNVPMSQRAGGDVRRLTPTECERLQALPDGWTYPWGGSLADSVFVPLRAGDVATGTPVDYPPDGPRYAACGDAVTASVAEWIADRIMRA